MKTTVVKADYETVAALEPYPHKKPKKPNLFWRTLIRLLTVPGLAGTNFRYTAQGLDVLGKNEPCLILMNHSCFLDMEIAYRILYPRPFQIICTSDGFVGMHGLMAWLMRSIGCVPTQKFVTDLTLVQDMESCLHKLKTSVLLYPEASYSFDGTCTPLPRKMGVLLKRFDVPVVMIETFGAFSRNPLYNELQVRKSVPVSAQVKLLYSREDIHNKTVEELSQGLDMAFAFNHFKWQKETGIKITDNFRADGLHRILYRCPHCGAEGKTLGKGTRLTCNACGKSWTLTPLGELEAEDGQTEFAHIPDWYAWERAQVRQELEDGTYRLDTHVDIAMLVDFRAIYQVGQGRLVHDRNGFRLTGCDGKLSYTQKPQACYSLYADYYWYEIGDMVCIGNNRQLYYCFPKENVPVAKVRLATEELYKLTKRARRKVPATESLDRGKDGDHISVGKR